MTVRWLSMLKCARSLECTCLCLASYRCEVCNGYCWRPKISLHPWKGNLTLSLWQLRLYISFQYYSLSRVSVWWGCSLCLPYCFSNLGEAIRHHVVLQGLMHTFRAPHNAHLRSVTVADIGTQTDIPSPPECQSTEGRTPLTGCTHLNPQGVWSMPSFSPSEISCQYCWKVGVRQVQLSVYNVFRMYSVATSFLVMCVGSGDLCINPCNSIFDCCILLMYTFITI